MSVVDAEESGENYEEESVGSDVSEVSLLGDIVEAQPQGWFSSVRSRVVGVKDYLPNMVVSLTDRVKGLPVEISKTLTDPLKKRWVYFKESLVGARDRVEDVTVAGGTFVVIGGLVMAGSESLGGNPLFMMVNMGLRLGKIVGLAGVGAITSFKVNGYLRERKIPFKMSPLATEEREEGVIGWLKNWFFVFPRPSGSFFCGVTIGGFIIGVYNSVKGLLFTNGYYR